MSMKGESVVDENEVHERGACIGGASTGSATDEFEKQLNHKGYI